MKTTFYTLMLSALLAFPVTALETVATRKGEDTTQSATESGRALSASLLTSMTTFLNPILHCQTQNKFYFPNHADRDADGCVGWTMTMENPVVNVVTRDVTYHASTIPNGRCSTNKTRQTVVCGCSETPRTSYSVTAQPAPGRVDVEVVTCRPGNYVFCEGQPTPQC